jgi:hypothetical protein
VKKGILAVRTAASGDDLRGTRIAAERRPHHVNEGTAKYYEDDSGAMNFAAGLLLGAVLGASLALLAAPQSGRKTRRRLLRAVSTARDAAGDRFEDLTDEVQSAVRAGRKRIRV